MSNKKAKEALTQMKQEAANTVGVSLKQGYNGDITARQARLHRRRDGQAHDRELRERSLRQVSISRKKPRGPAAVQRRGASPF